MKLITPRIVERVTPAVWEGIVLLLMALAIGAGIIYLASLITL
jgi:hypothetical protein